MLLKEILYLVVIVTPKGIYFSKVAGRTNLFLYFNNKGVEKGLTEQIGYLTQVATGQPHEGSTYGAEKVTTYQSKLFDNKINVRDSNFDAKNLQALSLNFYQPFQF